MRVVGFFLYHASSLCKTCTRNSGMADGNNSRPYMPHSWFHLHITRNHMFLWVYIWRSLDAFVYFTHDAMQIVDVIAPGLSYPIISIPICLLIALNLCMHYFYAITISPGFLDDPPRDTGNSFLWAQKPSLDSDTKEKKTMIRGASWSEKGVKITPASMAECQKCKKLRPEVSLIPFLFLRVMLN